MTTATSPQPRTGLALWSLILGVLGLPTIGCLGVGAIAGIVLAIMALSKINKNPAEYGGKGMAIAGLVTNILSLTIAPFVLGIVAAIAIPGLLRARVSANESGALGDIRTVLSAEAVYASQNGGYYDTPECLAAPANCIPGYAGPPLLDAGVVTNGEKSGYRRTFHLGSPAPGGDGTSPTRVSSFAITAAPAVPNRTGVRAFCADSTGRICQTMDGSEPVVEDGRCPDSCQTMN